MGRRFNLNRTSRRQFGGRPRLDGPQDKAEPLPRDKSGPFLRGLALAGPSTGPHALVERGAIVAVDFYQRTSVVKVAHQLNSADR